MQPWGGCSEYNGSVFDISVMVFFLGMDVPIHKEILFNNLLVSAQSELITSSITQGRSFHIPQEYAAAWVEILSLSYWLFWQVGSKCVPQLPRILSSCRAGELRCVYIFIYEQFCTSAAMKCLTVLVFWIWLHIWNTHSSSTKIPRPKTPAFCWLPHLETAAEKYDRRKLLQSVPTAG